MAERYLFFNSVEGDRRVYQASNFAEYFGSVLSTGLLHTDESPGMDVSVEQGTLNTVTSVGKAIMKGRWYENTTARTLTHSIAEPDLDRIDRIVLRLNLYNGERNILLHVKEGMPSSEPEPPELQRDNFIYELSLGQIRVRANTSSLNPDDLVDERLNESVCGLTYSLISIPTEELVNQFNLWMDDFINTRETDFEAWLAYLESILDENTAGNLLNLIEQNKISLQEAIQIRRDVTLTPNTWVEGDVYYEYYVEDTGVIAESVVDVTIHKNSLLNAAYLLPVTESVADGFILYSSKIPEGEITIDYRITREAG